MVPDRQGGAEADPDLARRLFEASPDGVWVFDDDGITTFANARMAEIVGRRVAGAELLLADLTHEIEVAVAALQRATAGRG
jgi:PAS domain S-box-containing protein